MATAPAQNKKVEAPPALVLIQWKCESTFPAEMTVGTKFTLKCDGPPAPLDKTKLGLEVAKQDRFLLRLIETKSLGETGGEFVATTWASGKISFENPILTDGVTKVGLGRIEFEAKSVLDPQKNPEGKPYPPWGGVTLGWPWIVWALILFVVLIAIVGVGSRVGRIVRRKRLLKLLEKNPVAGEPYHVFTKELRRLVRSIPVVSGAWSETDKAAYLGDLDQALRWYIARAFVIPVFDRTPREILADLKRVQKNIYQGLRRDLGVTLGEIESARKQAKKVTVEDVQQITELARQLADKIRVAAGGV